MWTPANRSTTVQDRRAQISESAVPRYVGVYCSANYIMSDNLSYWL